MLCTDTPCRWQQSHRDENGFGIFRYFGNRFRNFSVGFIGNGIFRKRNRFSEFSIGIGVVFYRPFPSVIGFCRKLPDLCLRIFRNCVSEFFSEFSSMWFFRITCMSLDKDYLFLYFLDVLRFFLGIDGVRRQMRLTVSSFERIHHFLCTCYVLIIYNDREPTVCLFHTLDFRVLLWGCEKTLYVRKKYFMSKHAMLAKSSGYCELWVYELVIFMNLLYCELVILWTCDLCKLFIL